MCAGRFFERAVGRGGSGGPVAQYKLYERSLQPLLVAFEGPAEAVNIWGLGAVPAIQYILAGVLTASNRPGAPVLGLLAGLSLAFLGLGAFVLEGGAGVIAVWGSAGALLAILAGAAFFAPVVPRA